MVGLGEGAAVRRDVESAPTVRMSPPVNWAVILMMTALLLGAVAGVVLALSSGMPTVAILIALVTGAVFGGLAC
ncbi:MAG: hypothetical protein KDB44_09390 [Mycobacterium sp.]|nr:hypothetical protein [Mycobacterium sp.]